MHGSTTSNETGSNRRAHRESDFSALEMLVNTGDSVRDLQRFRSQHPDFFSREFYERSEKQAIAGTDTLFNWYKLLLRKVWEGRDPDNYRLGILLGSKNLGFLNTAIPAEFQQEWVEHMRVLAAEGKLEGVDLTNQQLLRSPLREFSSEFVPDWRSGGVILQSHVRAQRAIYELMRQSWKARVCRICPKYFIADKPATFFCSVQCAAEGKKQRDREIWRTRGSAARVARRAKEKAREARSKTHKR